MNNLVIVKTFTTRLEAEFARGYLEANGIKAVVTADDEGGMYPYPMSPTVNQAKVLVVEKDLKKVQTLLEKAK